MLIMEHYSAIKRNELSKDIQSHGETLNALKILILKYLAGLYKH